MENFKVIAPPRKGDKVLFGRTHGEQTAGTVIKVNRKTVLVRQDESRGTMRDYKIGTKWKVPFSLCKPANGSASVEAEGTPEPASARLVGVGTTFRATVHDCSVLWRVTRKAGRNAWEAVAVNEPYEHGGKLFDSDFSGATKAFLTRDIEMALGLEAFFESNKRTHESFYAGLKPGQVVHYHNGFGEYVRCLVDETVSGERQLRPVALVGKWHPGHNGYYRRLIEDNATFTPNASNIYENPDASPGAKEVDPRGMKPVEFKGQLGLELGT